MMQAQQNFEFNKTFDANDGAAKSTASDAMRPNMANPDFNADHRSASKTTGSTGGNNLEFFCGTDPPKDPQKEEETFKTQTPEQKRIARTKVVDKVTEAMTRKENKLILGRDEKQLVMMAMEHQLNAGGVKAADTICEDISAGLPKGYKLESRKDPEFEKQIKEAYEKANLPVPEYIRWVELKDKSGIVIGEFGVTVGKIPK